MFIYIFPGPVGRRARWMGREKRRLRTKRLVRGHPISYSPQIPHTVVGLWRARNWWIWKRQKKGCFFVSEKLRTFFGVLSTCSILIHATGTSQTLNRDRFQDRTPPGTTTEAWHSGGALVSTRSARTSKNIRHRKLSKPPHFCALAPVLLVGLQGATRLKVLSGPDPWQVLLSFHVWIAMGSLGALRATDREPTA